MNYHQFYFLRQGKFLFTLVLINDWVKIYSNQAESSSTAMPVDKKSSKFECPECQKKLCNLPRHLRSVHGYDNKAAAAATLFYRLRAIRGNSDGRSKNPERTSCPIRGCLMFVSRIPRHLKTAHQLVTPQQRATAIREK